jgi:hypothetical protein
MPPLSELLRDESFFRAHIEDRVGSGVVVEDAIEECLTLRALWVVGAVYAASQDVGLDGIKDDALLSFLDFHATPCSYLEAKGYFLARARAGALDMRGAELFAERIREAYRVDGYVTQ